MKQRSTCLFFWLALLAFPMEVARAGAGLDYVINSEGEVSLLQTDFGITPIKVGGGAVRVKNKVRIRFDVVASALGRQ